MCTQVATMATRTRSARTTRRRAAGSPRARPEQAPPAGPPPGKRASNKAGIRDRIVAAALSLFQSRGFDETTTRAIARKAGIAEGTVFNYFRTKEDIALHFFELEVDHAIAAVRSVPALRRAPLEEKLFALIQHQFEYLAPYERFIATACIEALKPSSKLGFFSHRAQALRHRYVAFVEELFQESMPPKTLQAIGWWAPDAFWIYYIGALLFWLHDTSARKQKTLAFLDRTLKLGVGMLTKAG